MERRTFIYCIHPFIKFRIRSLLMSGHWFCFLIVLKMSVKNAEIEIFMNSPFGFFLAARCQNSAQHNPNVSFVILLFPTGVVW